VPLEDICGLPKTWHLRGDPGFAPLQAYIECHYLAHSNLIDAISEESCRQLCLAVSPHVGQFFYWVGENCFQFTQDQTTFQSQGQRIRCMLKGRWSAGLVLFAVAAIKGGG
jgi:hypothetical protein